MTESSGFDDAVIRWLLESKIPSIHYFALRDLLHKPETDPDVQAVRHTMTTDGPIPEILARQTDAGHWANEHSYYTPKYRSTHWSMMLLTELGIDPADERFQRGIHLMLSSTQPQREEHLSGERYGFLCLWSNILRYTAYGGCLDNPHAQQLIDCIQQQVEPFAWRCPHNGGLACAWGIARTLWGLAALPSEWRDRRIANAIDSGLEFLLNTFSLVDANYPTSGETHHLWHTLNFPIFYQADILLTLRVVAEIGQLSHPGAQAALNWLRERRQANGFWHGSSPFRSRTWSVGSREDTHRWVTLEAARILQAA
jgi:hypothetical protein